MIRAGAHVTARDEHYRSLMHIAAIAGSYEVSALLIQFGADVATIDDRGKTPLHYAAEHNWVSGCRLLIENGGNVYGVDKEGRTPLEVVVSAVQGGVYDELVKAGHQLRAKRALLPASLPAKPRLRSFKPRI